jgi:hypothetical protein
MFADDRVPEYANACAHRRASFAVRIVTVMAGCRKSVYINAYRREQWATIFGMSLVADALISAHQQS